jgi:uncharacterized protein YdaU (DUF1376 family)
MAQPPSFPLYVGDYLTGTMSLSPAERGAYMDCLCYQWEVAGVPADDLDRLARVMRCPPGEARKLWANIADKFQKGADGLYRNARVEVEREKKQRWHKTRKANGEKGGRPRKQQTTSEPPHRITSEHPQNLVGHVPSPSPSESTTQTDARSPELSPPAASRRGYANPHGFRTDLTAAASIVVGDGQIISVPASWAQKACREYRLTLTDIDTFAAWAKSWVAQHGFEDAGKRLAWLDARLAEWRLTRRAAAASSAAVDDTERLLAERAELRASLPPVAEVVEGLRAGRAKR